ncbi:hypothetical protein [Halorussus halophilus]|uniref:hypothetical protein n=1 Tax=Halorussus halophilus TaxID=2650975 RepID=UPI001300E3BF|nr:hypothetical protein [Halorussus halophilus]
MSSSKRTVVCVVLVSLLVLGGTTLATASVATTPRAVSEDPALGVPTSNSVAIQQLTNESEPNDDAQSANPITGATEIRGTIPVAGDIDFYSINASSDDNLLINVSRFGQEFGLFGIAVADSEGNFVASALLEESSNENLTVPLEEAGQYYVIVASASQFRCPECSAPSADGTGEYSLAIETFPRLVSDGNGPTEGVEREPNEEVDFANPIQSGQAFAANISNETDTDWFTINATKGQTLRVDIARAGGTGTFAVLVGSPGGRALAGTLVNASERKTLVVPSELVNSTGTYSVVVLPLPDNPGSGRYSFVVSTGQPVTDTLLTGSSSHENANVVTNASRNE